MRTVDGKFSTDGTRIFNTVSGEVVPEEEPLFLLRARDAYALAAINAYQIATEGQTNELHQAGLQQVREKFCRFQAQYPERMKQPGITRHLKLEPMSAPKSSATATEQARKWRLSQNIGAYVRELATVVYSAQIVDELLAAFAAQRETDVLREAEADCQAVSAGTINSIDVPTDKICEVRQRIAARREGKS